MIVAEDEENNYLLIKEFLSDLNLQLIHTKDGQQTIEASRTIPQIDLILMDLKMPVMGGEEAAKVIRAERPDLPIVAQSAHVPEHENSLYRSLFNDYLTKPIDESELKQIVLKYIEA